MQMIQVFGTWVGVARLNSLDINKALEYVQTLDMDKDEVENGGYTTKTQRILDESIFTEVKKEIEVLAKEYVTTQGHIVEEVSIASSWGNTLSHDEVVRPHSHPNSYVSGVFYLTAGAPLNFHNPLKTEDLFTFRPVVEWDGNNPHTWQVVHLETQPGWCFFFPSQIKHHVDSNTSDYRYSIAFNTVPTGEFGNSTTHLNITNLV